MAKKRKQILKYDTSILSVEVDTILLRKFEEVCEIMSESVKDCVIAFMKKKVRYYRDIKDTYEEELRRDAEHTGGSGGTGD